MMWASILTFLALKIKEFSVFYENEGNYAWNMIWCYFIIKSCIKNVKNEVFLNFEGKCLTFQFLYIKRNILMLEIVK